MQIYSITGLSVLTTLVGAIGIVSTAYAADPTSATPTQEAQETASPFHQGQPLEFKLSETTSLQTLEGRSDSGKTMADRGVSRSADALKPQPPTIQAQPVAESRVSSQPAAPTPSLPLSPLTQAPATTAEDVQILSPKQTITSQKFTDLVIRYPTGAKVEVMVNQQPLGSGVATQTQDDPVTNQTTQVWYRIPLQRGENTLTVRTPGGTPSSITVKVQETAAKIEFLPIKEGRVPADGRSALTVEGQILDEAGQPLQKDTVVTLTASAGKFAGADYDKDRPGFQVLARGGKFRAQLQSGLQPQMVKIRAAVDRKELVTQEEKKRPTNIPYPETNSPPYLLPPDPDGRELETYTQAEFITNLRPFILAGQVNLRFGQAGLDFYNRFRDFLRPSLIDQGYRVDFSTAAFATGRIGEWLVTGAFNNQRSLNEDCSGAVRLFRQSQFCEQPYPVYGDSSTIDFLTPSIDSVYFKIERTSPVFGAGTDYLMWGDYGTQEFARASQFYTATTRELHGLKANYNLGDLQITFAFANNVYAFQRDTIAPNGTSGYYYLSRRLVIGGSENIFIETQEFDRPGTVIERKPLYRGPDYEIDYDRGAILFRRNINALEFDPFGRTLRRQIVVTYQYDGAGGDGGKLYAGRVQYNFSRELNRESWAGFTYLREDQGAQQFELYGGDLLVSLGKDAQIIGEVAHSSFDSIFQGNQRGNAYRFEAFGTIIPGVFARAFYRSVEEGFNNNASASFTPGQTRYGAEVAAKLTPTTQALVQFDREINFGNPPAITGITSIINAGFGDLFNPSPEPIPGTRVNNSLTTFRAGVSQKVGPVELGLDYRHLSRQDRNFSGRLEADSNQIISRLTYPILTNLIFRAQNEQNIGTPDPLYPNRTTVGLDWLPSPDVTVRLAQQFIGRTSELSTNSFTSLDILSNKRITDDFTYTSRYTILGGANGWSTQSAFGLNYGVRIAPGVRLNAGYERVAVSVLPFTQAGQQFLQPVAVGQSSASLGLAAYTSYSIGLDYTDNPNFKASGRFEFRDGDGSNDTMVISAGAAGKLSPALTALARYQQGNFANQLLVDSGLADTINLRVGLAYRNPYDDKFNALLSYEFRQNPSIIPDTLLFGSGTGSNVHLVALEMLYAPNFRWEFYGKFAWRNTTSYLARDLLGTNAITLGQVRATYRFGYRWDVAAEARWIGQSLVDYNEVGLAAELGYYLTPSLRLALGYNFGKANDRDFNRTKDGVYVNLSLKLDQLLGGFGVRLPDYKVAPPQQQESVVKPVASQSTTTQPTTTPAAASPVLPAQLSEQPSATPPESGNPTQ
jgi:hypothetical protein